MIFLTFDKKFPARRQARSTTAGGPDFLIGTEQAVADCTILTREIKNLF